MKLPNSKKRRCGVAFLLACVLLLPVEAALAGSGFGEDTVNIRLGTFLSDFDTRVSLTGPAGNGVEANLEDQLGLEPDQLSFRGDLMWRLAPRHRVMLGYYRFDRSASADVTRDFTWEFPDGDTVQFSAGVNVDSSFDWQLVPLTYAYSFYKSDRLELAAQLGLHWFDLSVGVTGDAIVNGAPVASFVSKSESASGPLPVLGFQADYALTRNWLVGAHAQYFGLDYDVYSGNLTDLRLQTEYRFHDNFSIGLGYTWYDISITREKDSGYRIGADYTYNGLEAYVGFRF